MSKLTEEDVRYVARLSKFVLSDDEIEMYKQELSAILSYAEQLQELETEQLETTAQVTGLKNVTRKDKVQDYGVEPEQLLACAPKTEARQIKAPRAL